MQQQKYQAYLSATQTVAKTRQVVLLYEGAIRFIQQAKEAIEHKRIEERYHLLTRASDIINGLQGCLDFENGGDIAVILYNFYSSIDLRIFSIHHSNSTVACDELVAELKQMRDAWHEIDLKNASGQAGDSAAAPLASASSADGADSVTLSA